MKQWAIAALVALMPVVAFCEDKPYIYISAPYVGQVNKPFQIQVSLVPPSKEPVTIELESKHSISYSVKRFQLTGSQVQLVLATIKSNPRSGLEIIYAFGDNEYQSGWGVVDVGFDGRLKSNWSEPLTRDRPTTLSLAILDKEGKPIPFESDLELTLDSADGILNPGGDQTPTKMTVPGFSRSTPQFQIKPRSALGGNVHLSAVLTVPNYSHVLAQEQFVFAAQPAWWVPVLLAIFGGLLHATYKIVRMTLPTRKALYTSIAIVATSCVAAFIGYLFADFDLLGLKLDPNVLRTYPIVGFLFSYFGIEGLLSNKFANLGTQTVQPQPSTGAAAGQTAGEDAEAKKQRGSKDGDDKAMAQTAG